MAKLRVKVDYSELKKLGKQLEKLQKDIPDIMNELAAQQGEIAIGEIKKRTGVITGNLRDSFHSNVSALLNKGGTYTVWIMNNVPYASYYEYGHRIVRNGKTVGYVRGRYVMTIGVRYYKDNIMKRSVKQFIDKKLKGYMK